MTEPTITCPMSKTKIKLTDSLAAPVRGACGPWLRAALGVLDIGVLDIGVLDIGVIQIAAALCFVLVCCVPTPARAAEIYSNATGGGAWSDRATWRGGVVPAPEDDVVLAHDDTVTFDRNDDSRVTCRQLSLDPRSVLQFKTGAGPILFSAGGLVESYGSIKLDASRAAADRHEIRLVSADPEQRVLRLAKGGGLVVAGRAGLPKGGRNAFLCARPPKTEPPTDPTGILEAADGNTIDIHRAEVENLYVQASTIDNTGAKPGERVNFVRNHFIGTSRLKLVVCDTPLVADNLFERDAAPALLQAAIYLQNCPLAEVRGNTVRGTYAYGIMGYGQTDSSVTNNLIEKCPYGFYWIGSDTMIRQLTVRDCVASVALASGSLAMEDVTIERCKSGYYNYGTAQATNLVLRNMLPDCDYEIYFGSGSLKLVNCNIKPEQIKWHPGAFPPQLPTEKRRPPAVESMHFLVAQLKGQFPPGASIEVRTAAPAVPLVAGANDPNVRNSPAPILSSGFTPLPKSLEPLILRGWMFDPDGKPVAAPEYQLKVLAPATAAAGERPVLKTVSVTPGENWYRPQPNDKKATVEVTLP